LHLGDWETANMGKTTQLAQAFWRLMRGSSLIGVQASSCGSSKYMMLTYLAKNNNIENIQCPMKTKGKNANSATLYISA